MKRIPGIDPDDYPSFSEIAELNREARLHRPAPHFAPLAPELDFPVGTIIAKRSRTAIRRWVVLDPQRTLRGKLRLENVRTGGEIRVWWSPFWLPRGYYVQEEGQ